MTTESRGAGGYDDGYRVCSCFWGRQPGSLVQWLSEHIPDPAGMAILDAGCGEGKNAAYLACLGAKVRAVDISPLAIANARTAWPNVRLVEWEVADIRTTPLAPNSFSVVIAYGLLHCLTGAEEIRETVRRLQRATRPGGYNVVCVFNDRFQDLRAHPNFEPTLMNHGWYLDLYREWQPLHESDQNLHETHPHNSVPHVHSMTRLLARKGKCE